MDEVKKAVGAAQTFCRGNTAQPQAEGHILARGEVREEAVGLEHHPHVAPVGGLMGDVAAAQPDLAGIKALQAGEGAECRRLAAAGGTEERHEFAGRHLQRQPIDAPRRPRSDAVGR